MTKWDTGKWKREVNEKSSLEIYKSFKTEIKDERIYDNDMSSVILYRERTNNLQLNNRKIFSGGEVKYDM